MLMLLTMRAVTSLPKFKRNGKVLLPLQLKNKFLLSILNTYFLKKHRAHVLKLRSQPSVAELDARQFLHKEIFDKLTATHSNILNEGIGKLAFQQRFFEDNQVPPNALDDFDAITSTEEFSQAMDFLNKQSNQCWRNNKKSGNDAC